MKRGRCALYAVTGPSSAVAFVLALAPAVAVAQGGTDSFAADGSLSLLGAFEAGWRDAWRERVFEGGGNTYRTVAEDTNLVLQVESERAASALWRGLDVSAEPGVSVSWRWKLVHPIRRNTEERERRGDDYAARVFVIFDGTPFDRHTRALCYVWASTLPETSVFPSPYTENVAMVVLESGDRRTGRWLEEERDVVADFVRAFGEPPARVTGVAVMVDTDDTRTRATARFDDIVVGRR